MKTFVKLTAVWIKAFLRNACHAAIPVACAAGVFSIGGIPRAEAVCVTNGAEVTCTGDESTGIASGADFLSPPATTLIVNTDPITSGGIYFNNSTASSVNVLSGTEGAPVLITTQTGATPGITASSQGSPSGYHWISAVGVYVPNGPAGGGGPVTVDSHSTISTSGDQSHGIVAQNRVGTYDPVSTMSLLAFTPSSVNSTLVSVAGSTANIGNAVAGSNGGSFTLSSDGLVSFSRGTLGDALQPGESLVTSLSYTVQLTHNPVFYPFTNASQFMSGSLATKITNTNGVITVTDPQIYFAEFGVLSDPTGPAPLWPNLQGYVNRLLAEQGFGGNGQSIVVTNAGAVTTRGNNAHGIFAETTGGSGGTGSTGGLFDGPAGVGGTGSNGGGINVTANGTITTYGNESAGVVAVSRGGNGGTGGDGGWGGWRWGGQGGNGGNGGAVTISGSGSIETGALQDGQTTTDAGNYSSGILALSEGGNGGNGGEGHHAMPGGNGGWGGSGGPVVVDGDWDIATRGIWAHGIWAKSVGGNAGSGGSAGWMGIGSGGAGGQAADGGNVTVISRGTISTSGNDSYGIFAQSVGGFGGGGGSGGYIFYSHGGNGDSAGSGGAVSATNSGSIATQGDRAHGIYAQSVGGGGGSGIGGGGIVSIGGSGGAGGNGGAVTVANDGSIRAYGSGARGIFAKSIGGGGGDGGDSDGVYSVGGSGASTGNGGDVSVTNAGTIETGTLEPGTEDPGVIKPGTVLEGFSSAIHAQSIGGGGGSGYDSDGVSSIGGSGGAAGNGGAVSVTNTGTLVTWADFSRGILAQSVGGGGGDGAASRGLISYGGSAGLDTNHDSVLEGGGDGGAVGIVSSGSITTHGDYSDGIYAQSIGGGGGSGASSRGIYAEGGSGARGGLASAVTITNSGSILTEGYRSRGIFAESIGGGGGDAAGVSGWWAIGGSGSSTDNGGTVTVLNGGSIETREAGSSAIHVQSIGGGGGSGASAENFVIAVNVGIGKSIGGDGGAGGEGGDLTVTNENSIATHKENSHGIFAQSIGGGGGSGGDSVTYHLGVNILPLPATVSFTYTIGGKGSIGGNGGIVQINNSGGISTEGFRSHGVFAQSVGGGGGDGGSTSSYGLCIGCTMELREIVGGSGGGAGNGGAVSVGTTLSAITGTISTQGDHSAGILAQSIGGGGGSAGNASNWDFDFNFAFSPEDLAPGVGFTSTSVLSGSSGTTGSARGNGGSVLVNSAGIINTQGAFAHGILAQSVGGGGGSGGDTHSYNYTFSINPTDYVPYLDAATYSYTQILGGDGGNGGAGAAVTVTNSGGITTQGSSAYGILAQSVGGGGGAAGNVFNLDCNLPDLVRDLAPGLANNYESVLRGRVGGSGNGGEVTVDNRGSITTHGEMAHGILAQSIGGGGGAAGAVNQYGVINTDFGSSTRGLLEHSAGAGATFLGSLGGSGSGGAVTVTNTGTVLTTGRASHGILAQSAGGISGGAVTIMTSGNIFAQGEDSIGILAQSTGRSGTSNVSITIDGGIVQGGTGTQGAGVSFLDGAANALVNRGEITTMNTVTGIAIRGAGGSETINNYGTITGSIDLGTGVNAFNNNAGGVMNSGGVLNLGTGNMFTNAGSLAPGGQTAFMTTALTGNFTQTSSGSLNMKIDHLGNHDKLEVSGSASLGGSLAVIKQPGPYLTSMTYDLLETRSDVISGTFGSVTLPEDRPLVTYELNQTSNLVELRVDVQKYTTAAADPTKRAVADYLDRILPTATGDLAVVLDTIQTLSLSQLNTAYASLSPATYDGLTKTSLSGMQHYLDSLRQRLNKVRAYSIASGYGNEQKPILLAYHGPDANLGRILSSQTSSQPQIKNELWMDGYSQWGDQGGTHGVPGYDYAIDGGTIGYEYAFRNNMILGLSFGLSNARINFDGGTQHGSVKDNIGTLYGSYFTEKTYVESAISYGRESFQNQRYLSIGPIIGQASSSHDGDVYSLYLGAGYNFDASKHPFAPFCSLRYIHLKEDGFAESGAGSLNLIVDSRETESLVAELGARAGYAFRLSKGSLIPEMSASFLYDFAIDDNIVTSSFAGSPGATFSIHGQEPAKYGAALGVGLTFLHNNGFSASVKYGGEFRERYSAHGVIGNIAYAF